MRLTITQVRRILHAAIHGNLKSRVTAFIAVPQQTELPNTMMGAEAFTSVPIIRSRLCVATRYQSA